MAAVIRMAIHTRPTGKQQPDNAGGVKSVSACRKRRTTAQPPTSRTATFSTCVSLPIYFELPLPSPPRKNILGRRHDIRCASHHCRMLYRYALL